MQLRPQPQPRMPTIPALRLQRQHPLSLGPNITGIMESTTTIIITVARIAV